jgi:hypothetical protein
MGTKGIKVNSTNNPGNRAIKKLKLMEAALCESTPSSIAFINCNITL